MLSLPTTLHLVGWPLLVVPLTLGACRNIDSGVKLHATDALGHDLRNRTTVGVTLPAGCSTVAASLPAGKNGFTLTYLEPSTNATGSPLTNLLLTSIYIGTPNGQSQVTRIWTNDSRGGGTVTIQNVVPPAPEFRLCVTATNLAGQESPPAPPTQPKP
jgi:hypothetical protein